MVNEWIYPDDWQGYAWLNGEDVSQRCRGVLMDDERPIALDLYILGADGQAQLNASGDALVAEIFTGDIRVSLRPRRG